ncbi:MAG TPA: PAS domain-containing protein, partial [bacterium]|nr:PAS domain-containing protein [bacterium]
LSIHEIIHAKKLEAATEIMRQTRPDLVIYFIKDKGDDLEEHVLNWLISGFRGKILLFDSQNRVKDSEALIHGQVIDEYHDGPIGQNRFLSILKSHMTHDFRFAPPRAMTTFDLFRNLFDRCLNAIFLFNEGLNRCVTANLQAERMTGKSLEQLRRLGLKHFCSEAEYESHFLPSLRKAARSYYDVKGLARFKGEEGEFRAVTFSCGIFDFGRKKFLKVEIQVGAEPKKEEKPRKSRRSLAEAPSILH